MSNQESQNISRRQFLGTAALAAGAAVLTTNTTSATAQGAAPDTSPALAAAKRTARDIVPLGNTGLKVSRLGLGLGSSNGQIQANGGQDGFNRFIKHAFDSGITMYDTAANYYTYTMMGAAIKGLPRDKIFIQSKIDQPNNITAKIDDHRKQFNTDYVDSMLVHIQYRENWLDTWKKAMDEYNTAIDKKWIKARGVSCHSLPALRKAVEHDWIQVHLVRVNPQGYRLDSERQVQDTMNGTYDIKPVVEQLKKMRDKNRGVIGMKIFGDGKINTDAEREKSLKFSLNMKEIDSIIIGFANINQMDQGIKMTNKVLAAEAA